MMMGFFESGFAWCWVKDSA